MAAEKHLMETLADKFNEYKTGYFFPNDDVDPKEKKGEWCLLWQQAIWSLFITNSCYSAVSDYQQLRLLRLYGAGRQPNNIYKDLLLGEASINPLRRAFLSTNWEVFSPAPKFKRLIRGRFESQDYRATANAIDPTSQAKKEDRKWEIWYDSQYGEKERDIIKMVTGLDQEEQKARYTAKSLEELDTFNEMGGIKLKEEAETEAVLDATDYVSDIKTVKEKVVDDLVDWGRAAFRDFYDAVTGLVKKEYVDWENLILDYSIETDFKDIRFWSYIKFETINNVRVKNPLLSEDELMKMARVNCGYWGNMQSTQFNQYRNQGYLNEKGVRIYNQFRVPVLISEWISTDTEYRTVKEKGGIKLDYPQEYGKIYDTRNKKTKINRVNNVYNSTWIIGTKYVYDDGVSLNVARPDQKEPQLSIHAEVLPGKSIIESVKGCFDQLALAWFRWQSAIAQASPAGRNIDLTQLEGIDLGFGTMTPMDLVMLGRQTGDTFERSANLLGKGNHSQRKAITRNEGGIGEFMNEIIATMDINFKYIADLTGIDLISGASMKPGETTATEVKHSSVATNDALQPLFTAWIKMQEHAAQTVSCKINHAIKYHPKAKETYEGILGQSGAKILSIGADTTAARMGIKLELKSNEEMTAFAMQTVMKAVGAGLSGGIGITPSDGYYFVDMISRGRVKHAMALFNYKMDKNQAESLKMQRENMALNKQAAVETSVAKSEGKLQEIKAQGKSDLEIAAIKALLEMDVAGNTALLELKQALIQETLLSTKEGTVPKSEAA